ncbi:unnamed protein product, partial [Ascophyllum nodosum]
TTHEEGAREPLRGPGMGWEHPERKRARVDTIDHQAGDFRALLDGNSAQAALPRELLLLCDKAREMLADTSARFGHFREVLVAMEGRADANGLV